MNFKILIIITYLISLSACSQLRHKESAEQIYTDSGYEEITNQEVLNYINILWLKLDAASNQLNAESKSPQIYVVKDSRCLALNDQREHLFISNSLISKLNSEAELFYILAHEFSHSILDHSAQSGSKNYEQELAADRYALAIMTDAGYNPWSAIDALITANSCNSWADSKDYPTPQERVTLITRYISYLSGSYNNQADNRRFNKIKWLLN